jgi:hypothetical protein
VAVGDVLEAPQVEAPAIVARSPWRLFWHRLRADRVALTALAFLVILVLLSPCAPS